MSVRLFEAKFNITSRVGMLLTAINRLKMGSKRIVSQARNKESRE